MRTLFLTLLICLLSTGAAFAQTTIYGEVISQGISNNAFDDSLDVYFSVDRTELLVNKTFPSWTVTANPNASLGDSSAVLSTLLGNGSLVLLAADTDTFLVYHNGTDVIFHAETGDFVFDANVGLGTAAPVELFHLADTSLDGKPAIVITGYGGEKAVFLGDVFSANEAEEGALYLYSDNSTKVSLRASQTSYFLGGNVGIGTGIAPNRLTVITDFGVYANKSPSVGDSSLTVTFPNGSPVLTGYASDGDTSYLEWGTSDQISFVDAGLITIGLSDTSPATRFVVTGDGNAAGGKLWLENAGNEDTTTDYFAFEAEGTTLNLGTEDDIDVFTFDNVGSFLARKQITVGDDALDIDGQIDIIDADGNTSTIKTGANFAGIYQDGGGSLTVLLVNGFEKVTTFDTDMPEVVSNGAHGTDDIVNGATGVYEVTFSAGATSAANNKTFEFFVFELDASPIGTAITSITKANPAVVTTSATHGLSGGERVKLTGVVGMTEVEDNIYTVVLLNSTQFSLDVDDGTDVDSGAYGSPGTDGLVYIATEITQVHSHRKFGINSDQGAFGGSGLVSLTASKTLELFFKGTTDDTNLTIGECSFYMRRIQ